MMNRVPAMGLFCLGLIGCLPSWNVGGTANSQDDDFSMSRSPMELQRDQVWIELEMFRVDRKEESGFLTEVATYDRITDRYPRWKENDLTVYRGHGNFRVSMHAWLRKRKEVQRKSYGIMVQSGARGNLMIQELVPRHRVDVWSEGQVIQSQEWTNVMGGLEVQPVLGQGDQVELTVTPLVHYYDRGDTEEIKMIDLRTVVHVQRGGTLLIGAAESHESSFGGAFLSRRTAERNEKIYLMVTVW